MTAPEPTPTAEHIDAVALVREPASVVGEFIDDAALMHAGRSIGTVASFNVATDLLTSTDPAVHAAMLAALVRAGVLTVDLMTLSDGYAGRLVTEWGAADLGGNAWAVAP